MLSAYLKYILGGIIVFSYLIGLIGKMIIFKQMKNFNISERPINILILMDELIYLTLITFMTFNLGIVFLGQQTPYEFFSTVFGMEIDELVSSGLNFMSKTNRSKSKQVSNILLCNGQD